MDARQSLLAFCMLSTNVYRFTLCVRDTARAFHSQTSDRKEYLFQLATISLNVACGYGAYYSQNFDLFFQTYGAIILFTVVALALRSTVIWRVLHPVATLKMKAYMTMGISLNFVQALIVGIIFMLYFVIGMDPYAGLMYILLVIQFSATFSLLCMIRLYQLTARILHQDIDSLKPVNATNDTAIHVASLVVCGLLTLLSVLTLVDPIKYNGVLFVQFPTVYVVLGYTRQLISSFKESMLSKEPQIGTGQQDFGSRSTRSSHRPSAINQDAVSKVNAHHTEPNQKASKV
jgi:hypothetical protein